MADDLASGGVLIHTLFEYAATDFNVKLAARRLHVHHNTARYGLAKIEERTGYELWWISDVIELLIAARTHPAPGRNQPG